MEIQETKVVTTQTAPTEFSDLQQISVKGSECSGNSCDLRHYRSASLKLSSVKLDYND